MPKRQSSAPRQRARKRHFLAAWIRSPLKIGALVPSSRKLAHAMAAEVDTGKPGSIIELGGGTGAVTQGLLSAGIPPERLIIIERDRKLHAVLTSHFPDLNILCADVAELDKVLIGAGVTRVNAIVSSLPLLSMPKPVRQAIVHQMAAAIGHDTVLIQFTYGPRSPISRQHLRHYHLQGRRKKLVVANVPPAHVWVYKKS